MAQHLTPALDSTFNSTEWNAAPYFSKLDEQPTPIDADYIDSSTFSAATTFMQVSMQLSSGTDPALSTGHVMRLRLNWDAAVFATGVQVVCNLWQGDPLAAGSYIATLDVSGGYVVNDVFPNNSGGFVTYEYTLTGPEADSITDYTDLWFDIQGSVGDVAGDTLQASWFELEVPGGDICTWWKIDGPGGDDGPFGNWFKEACSADGLTPPADVTFDFDFFWDGTFYPVGTIFRWTSTTAPDNTGWWTSDVDFQGAATLLDNARPKDLRSFTEITAFANGSAGYLGGFPGPVCSFGNRMVYAPGGYTVGTDLPPIRNFDGVSDREVATLPKTSSGGIPKGVMTMLAANGTVYLTSLDSGTSASDFAGRVFELDMESGNLTQIGTAFSSGQLPYCLAWHNGRLWMGTNSGAPGTTVGKIYYMRQDGIDSDWTIEHTLTSMCATSMMSFQGLLYIGTSGASGTAAVVKVRGTDNSYSTSLTGSGTALNNSFPAMQVFNDALYASYWNPTTTSEIHQLSMVEGDTVGPELTWATVYDQNDDSITQPWLAFPVDNDVLLALSGGLTYDAALILTEDGDTWEDRTVFLTQSTTHSTGLPGWAIVVR